MKPETIARAEKALQELKGKPLLFTDGKIRILNDIEFGTETKKVSTGVFSSKEVEEPAVKIVVLGKDRWSTWSEFRLTSLLDDMEDARKRFQVMNMSLLKHKLKIVQF